MTSNSSGCQPAYVEDYDSVISMVVPQTRRGAARERSGLSQSMSANGPDEVSDSGYSTSTPPNHDSPPPERLEPAPTTPRKESSRRGPTPLTGRPPSKSISRSATPAAPRNIPNAKPRERSSTMASTDNADECDCPDCKKPAAKSSPSAGSPGVLNSGAWPHHHSSSYHGSYGQSPQWGQDYSYPLRYDGYGSPADSNMPASGKSGESKKKDRNSIPVPQRPSSTFQGAMSSSYSSGFNHGYFPSASPAPPAPAPSSTCPPTSNYMYPPPPHSPAYGSSPYAPPPISIPPYGYAHGTDPWNMTPTTPSSGYPADYPPPPTASANRRNSIRASAPPPVFHDDIADYYPQQPRPPQRRSSRVPSQSSQERPVSWTSAQFESAHHRSMSVPPQDAYPPPPADPTTRRKISATPGPGTSRRRESGHAQDRNPSYRPSALSRAMESCAIDDDPVPPQRSHSRSHSHPVHHYVDPHNPHSGQLTRRQPHPDQQTIFPSRSSYHEEEYFAVPGSEEPLAVRYPAGMPVKLSVNGERILSRASGKEREGDVRERDNDDGFIAASSAYQHVNERRKQVQDQLKYGPHYVAGEGPPTRSRMSGEFLYRQPSTRRATVNAYGV